MLNRIKKVVLLVFKLSILIRLEKNPLKFPSFGISEGKVNVPTLF